MLHKPVYLYLSDCITKYKCSAVTFRTLRSVLNKVFPSGVPHHVMTSITASPVGSNQTLFYPGLPNIFTHVLFRYYCLVGFSEGSSFYMMLFKTIYPH